MKKKLILFVVFGLPYGGTTVSLVNIINYLGRKEQYEVSVLSFWNENNYFVDKISKNARIINVSMNSKKIDELPFGLRGGIRLINKYWWELVVSHPKRFMYIYNIIAKKKYDYEIGYTETDDVLSFLKYRKSNSKKYQWIHTDIFVNSETKQVQKKLQEIENIDKYFCVSQKIANTLYERYPSKKFEVYYNQFNKQELRKKSMQYQIGFLNEEIPHFIAVGRISEIKGYDRLVNAHYKLLKEGCQHYIHIIGDDQGYQKELQHLINKLQVNDTFILEGAKENPYPYFLSADGLIISSYSEGLPTVAIEAQILNCPVLSTNSGGINEIITASEGIIVENSQEGIVQGLKEFIKKIKSRHKFTFDNEKFTDLSKIEKIFE